MHDGIGSAAWGRNEVNEDLTRPRTGMWPLRRENSEGGWIIHYMCMYRALSSHGARPIGTTASEMERAGSRE